jgi:DNA-binding NarL/FixJ family response regulator
LTKATAEAVLEQLTTLVVDLALVDVALPAINGIDLAVTLHKQYPGQPRLTLFDLNRINYVGCAFTAAGQGICRQEQSTGYRGG